jgi:hypothetical protein
MGTSMVAASVPVPLAAWAELSEELKQLGYPVVHDLPCGVPRLAVEGPHYGLRLYAVPDRSGTWRAWAEGVEVDECSALDDPAAAAADIAAALECGDPGCSCCPAAGRVGG